MQDKKKKHILVVSQYFYPEEFRINDICVEWVKRGYEVTVVTGIPNYPQGRFFQGYGLLKRRRDNYQGVNIIRIPLIPRGKKTIGLAFNYISYVISGFVWNLFTKVKADHVFIFQMSPATQALVGVWYAKKHKASCCMYVQDLWPESITEITGITNKKVLSVIDRMMDYIYKRCNTILATSPSFVEHIQKRETAYDADGVSKVRYWPQYAEEFYQPVDKMDTVDLKDDGVFNIIFTGNIGFAQGLDILPKTARILSEQGVTCRFVLVGDGRYREKLEKEIAESSVENMFLFLGRKLPTEIPQYLALSDMAFLSFKKSELFSRTIPAKLQSYMACGMPILAVADGETKRVIEEASCGKACDFDRPDLLAQVIKEYIENPEELRVMRDNAQVYCRQHFCKKILMDLYEEITGITDESIILG